MAEISVIVPVYNVQKYLRKCLNSLVKQTFKDIEIIAVNDGSTDDSEEILKEYAEKYDNFSYYNKENGGLSDARNFGLKHANGRYVAFVDSDDYVDRTMYEKMYNKALENNYDYVECDFYWVYPNKNRLDRGIRYKNKNEMLLYGRVVAWNKLIKRDVITELFPKGLYFEDIEFFYKLIPNINDFAFVDEPLVYYVQRENSQSKEQSYKTAQIFNIFDNVFDYYRKNKIYDKYRRELEYSYARILLCSSLKRMCKIKDDVARNRLCYETWTNLNTKFPDWKKNKLLKSNNGKNLYMRTVNNKTFKFYCNLFKKL